MALENTSIVYRSKHDIRRDILALVSNGPMLKTRVMGIANMSFPQLKAYEQHLTERNLLKVNEGGLWQITENGKKWLKHANAMKDLEAVA